MKPLGIAATGLRPTISLLLILFLADRERQAGVERLAGHHSAIESPDLCKEPGCDTYMRNER